MFTCISNMSLNTKLSDIFKINHIVKTMIIGLPRLKEARQRKTSILPPPYFNVRDQI